MARIAGDWKRLSGRPTQKALARGARDADLDAAWAEARAIALRVPGDLGKRAVVQWRVFLDLYYIRRIAAAALPSLRHELARRAAAMGVAPDLIAGALAIPPAPTSVAEPLAEAA